MNKLISAFTALIPLVLVILFTVAPITSQAQTSIFDTSASSLFDNDDEFLKIDQAFAFEFYQHDNQLEVTFDIAPGYYLYKKQFKITAENATIKPVNLPEGESHEDEFFGVQEIYTSKVTFTVDITEAQADSSIKIRYQGCAEKGLCYPPENKTVEIGEIEKSTKAEAVLAALGGSDQATSNNNTSAAANNTTKNQVQASSSEQNQLADMLKQDSLLLTLLAFFAGGLLLSFTPCVFPMYPILTGIIVGQAKDNALSTKKAFTLSFFYVQGMAITYTILGIVVAIAGAQFQAMFQHPVVLIGLSVLFIFLALSMFGVFNLALPSSWQNALNNLSNKQKGGSILGVVMMGVISGLVASPCTTAPLTGALLYISQTGDIVLGASALYALSLGMGLPLLILGSSGGKILPKAGAWMNIVKNIFGLLLLAVPIFLLERIIPAMMVEALWTLLILASGSYFYVANQNLAKPSNNGFWYGLRALLVFLILFIGANKAYQLIYPTPVNVATVEEHHMAFVQITSLSALNAAVEQANNEGKTVMVDLYADWCIACKEFEEYTFSQPQVQQALNNSVLLQVDLTETGSDTSVELMESLDVFGLPSILFYNLKGEELTNNRVTGFMAADEFTQHINAIF